jgi:GDP-L-fucose synthase
MKKKLFVAGNKGMVGSAICRFADNYNLITDDRLFDLRNQHDVDKFISINKPDIVIISAAKVGGILYNKTYPADFLYDNLMISSNLINSSYKHGVERLLFLGSSCIYPKFATQPIKEEYLLQSELEPTNEGYAISKITGLKMCQYYRKQYGVTYHSVMPTNLYGLNDNYHPENSHVIPGMFHKFHTAKLNNLNEVEIWGSGSPKREFLYVDDLAKICLKLLEIENPPDWVNAGSDYEVTILDLAKKVAETVGYKGLIKTGDPKLDGTPRKKLNNDLLRSIIDFEETPFDIGLRISYDDFLKNF